MEMCKEGCVYIPGPACVAITVDKLDTPKMGESYIYIHCGVHGISKIAVDRLDWRNPFTKMSLIEQY
ncbi:unnamed protein product [Discosporangium mesarthrocarpum]